MRPHTVTESPKQETVKTSIKSSDQSQRNNVKVRQRARLLLDKLEYTATIDLIREAIDQGTEEAFLSKEYQQAANGSLVQADVLMEQGHYQSAAHVFKIVQDSYPQSPELQQQITISPAQLADKIDVCAEKLMEKGLVAYRSGAFTTAIDIWQEVLNLNPQHQAAQDSIQTTQMQLAKLKTINSKD